MSSLDRFSPPLASAGDDSREPYARVPSPRRDDYGVSGAGEDLSAWTRGRTPEESTCGRILLIMRPEVYCRTKLRLNHVLSLTGDRRGKRRRSPSPSGGGGGGGRGADTYIPSYHRDRSPPAYRDRREHGAAYGGPGETSYCKGFRRPSVAMPYISRSSRIPAELQHAPSHLPCISTDRYDTRTYGGRDSHDQFSGGPGYDRRGPPPP